MLDKTLEGIFNLVVDDHTLDLPPSKMTSLVDAIAAVIDKECGAKSADEFEHSFDNMTDDFSSDLDIGTDIDNMELPVESGPATFGIDDGTESFSVAEGIVVQDSAQEVVVIPEYTGDDIELMVKDMILNDVDYTQAIQKTGTDANKRMSLMFTLDKPKNLLVSRVVDLIITHDKATLDSLGAMNYFASLNIDEYFQDEYFFNTLRLSLHP
jgi:hypothetical protein